MCLFDVPTKLSQPLVIVDGMAWLGARFALLAARAPPFGEAVEGLLALQQGLGGGGFGVVEVSLVVVVEAGHVGVDPFDVALEPFEFFGRPGSCEPVVVGMDERTCRFWGGIGRVLVE